MGVDFEAPTAALFARLQAINGLKYWTRILQDWDQCAPVQQPALFLTSDQITEFVPNANLIGQAPPLWKLNLLVVVYAQSPDPQIAPSTILNPLIAGVCNALLRAPGDTPVQGAKFVANGVGQFSTTLGGLCAYTRIAGKIEVAEGLTGHVSVAHIPIEMVLTS